MSETALDASRCERPNARPIDARSSSIASPTKRNAAASQMPGTKSMNVPSTTSAAESPRAKTTFGAASNDARKMSPAPTRSSKTRRDASTVNGISRAIAIGTVTAHDVAHPSLHPATSASKVSGTSEPSATFAYARPEATRNRSERSRTSGTRSLAKGYACPQQVEASGARCRELRLAFECPAHGAFSGGVSSSAFSREKQVRDDEDKQRTADRELHFARRIRCRPERFDGRRRDEHHRRASDHDEDVARSSLQGHDRVANHRADHRPADRKPRASGEHDRSEFERAMADDEHAIFSPAPCDAT